MLDRRDRSVIFVDLDRTLVHTDMLFENALFFLKQNPLRVFVLPGWLLRGKSFLKHRLAEEFEFSPELLPYNRALLSHLKNVKSEFELVLITATNQKIA